MGAPLNDRTESGEESNAAPFIGGALFALLLIMILRTAGLDVPLFLLWALVG